MAKEFKAKTYPGSERWSDPVLTTSDPKEMQMVKDRLQMILDEGEETTGDIGTKDK